MHGSKEIRCMREKKKREKEGGRREEHHLKLRNKGTKGNAKPKEAHYTHEHGSYEGQNKQNNNNNNGKRGLQVRAVALFFILSVGQVSASVHHSPFNGTHAVINHGPWRMQHAYHSSA